MEDSRDITQLLQAAADGRDGAWDDAMRVVYVDLERLAAKHMRRRFGPGLHGITLEPAALVHETYLRMLGGRTPPWTDRRHFFRAAAEAMRRILIEHARKRRRIKRGGNRIRMPLSQLNLGTEEGFDEILALDDAIRRLEKQDPRTAEVVQMRFFAGLSVEETAQALELSERTVKREWSFARAWLFDALRDVGS